MEPENNQSITSIIAPLRQITPLSKYLAITLFIILPFLGGWIGYNYAQENIVAIEKIFVENAVVRPESEITTLKEIDKLPFGSVEGALKYLDGSSGLTEDILDRQNPSDILTDNMGPKLPGERYSTLSVYEHFTLNDCWIINNNRVYDVTTFFTLESFLPALGELKDKCGTDITAFLEEQPIETGSLNTARFSYPLSQFFIGVIEDEVFLPEPSSPEPTPTYIEIEIKEFLPNHEAYNYELNYEDTTDWVLYENHEYGFSLRHPPYMRVEEESNDESVTFKLQGETNIFIYWIPSVTVYKNTENDGILDLLKYAESNPYLNGVLTTEIDGRPAFWRSSTENGLTFGSVVTEKYIFSLQGTANIKFDENIVGSSELNIKWPEKLSLFVNY